MPTKRPLFLALVLILILLIGGGSYAYKTFYIDAGAQAALSGSGTVEATEVLIAPELAGKVDEVMVKEGDTVKTGDVLFRMDDALLKAQRNVAAAALQTASAASQTAVAAAAGARAQYDLTLTSALAEQKSGRTADWTSTLPANFNQPLWYFGKPEQLASVREELSAAQSALDIAQSRLTAVEEKAASGEFLAAEKRLNTARAAYDVAKTVLDTSSSAGKDLKDSAQKNYDSALAELKNAQQAYTDSVTTSGAADVLSARADTRVAQERCDATQDKLRSLETGAASPKVTAAQKSVEQAQLAAAQAKTAVTQAEANLALIDTQIAKLTVISPTDGVVLTRAIEPGEVVTPGSNLLTLTRLSDLTITVYIPESRYGELSLGQTAQVSADSFPGQTFSATVSHISAQAEFTPRNVQTSAGRQTTVFAIKLFLGSADGKLKPGMPADVIFQ